ncbi:MAG: hypothetical protein WD768_02535 [Phycisphaeraceae bacterium]
MSKRSKQSEALFEVWHVLVKYRWRFIVPAFLAATLVLAVGMVLPRKYKAEATFERRNDMVLAEIISRGAPRTMQDPRQSLTNEVLGDSALDELLDQLGSQLTADGKSQFDRAGLRADLKRKATVSYDISSTELDRVRLIYIGDEAELSQTIVNKLVHNYIDRTRKQIEDRLSQSAKFFSDEADRSRKTIEALETQQLTFEIDHAQLLPDSPNSVQTSLTEIQRDVSEMVQKRDTLASKVDGLRKAVLITPKTTPVVIHGKNPELTRLEDTLRLLHAKYEELTGVLKMKSKHPDVLALQQQIDGVRETIAGTQKEVVVQTSHVSNSKHAEFELLLSQSIGELDVTERRLAQIQTQAAKLDEQSGSLFSVRSDYRKLSRQIEDTQRQLSFWEDNLRLVAVSLAAESGDRGVRLAVIKECDPILRPVSPNLSQILLAAALLGVIIGGVSVFYAHRTDETFGSTERLAETFNLPVFGAVSEIISNRERRMRRLRNMIVFPVKATVMAGILIVLTGILYLNLEKPHVYEELRRDPVNFFRNGADFSGGVKQSSTKATPLTPPLAQASSVSIDRR